MDLQIMFGSGTRDSKWTWKLQIDLQIMFGSETRNGSGNSTTKSCSDLEPGGGAATEKDGDGGGGADGGGGGDGGAGGWPLNHQLLGCEDFGRVLKDLSGSYLNREADCLGLFREIFFFNFQRSVS
ncbi:hypothetical protein U1Q18_005922 [Sarracenia purpurea var. burkii]